MPQTEYDMAGKCLMTGCMMAALAAGYAYSIPEARSASPEWADTNAPIDDGAPDEAVGAGVKRQPRRAIRRAGGAEHRTAHQPSPALRGHSTLSATEPETGPGTGTTPATSPSAGSSDRHTNPDPNRPPRPGLVTQDGRAALERLLDAGKKAATPICQGC